jgi:predicted methyltransferase
MEASMSFRRIILLLLILSVSFWWMGADRDLRAQVQAPDGYHLGGPAIEQGHKALSFSPAGLSSLAQDPPKSPVGAVNLRDRLYQLDRALDIVGVKPGQIVGEVGAGKGYFTFKLARRVGPSGMVFANDILKEALEALNREAVEKSLINIETFLGTEDDPRLPKGILEMVFLVDAFHDILKPVKILGNLEPSLKPGAKVIIIDQEAEMPEPPKKSHEDERIYTREEFLDIISKTNFKVDRIDEGLPKHMIYILSMR